MLLNTKKRILAVDDDPFNLDILGSVLNSYGYDVIQARNGEEALEKMNLEPDLVLCDLMMPGISGFEVIKTIKSDKSKKYTPVVMLTSCSGTEEIVNALECGADDFILKPFNNVELNARVKSLIRTKEYFDQLELAENVLFTLAKVIEAKDPYTEGHTDRVGDLAVMIGEKLNFTSEDLEILKKGGTLHDIGKIAVPDHILKKEGKLSPEEFEIMKKHPIEGAAICEPLRTIKNLISIIRHHHECLDGSGYPDGLKGEQIPMVTRIIAVADRYDAITTNRPYRKALLCKEALNILQEDAKYGKVDKLVVEILSENIANWSPKLYGQREINK